MASADWPLYCGPRDGRLRQPAIPHVRKQRTGQRPRGSCRRQFASWPALMSTFVVEHVDRARERFWGPTREDQPPRQRSLDDMARESVRG
jgi:hypothetical protein